MSLRESLNEKSNLFNDNQNQFLSLFQKSKI